jgi:hypothetical protein
MKEMEQEMKKQLATEAAAIANQKLQQLSPEEVERLRPKAEEQLIPVEKKLLKRRISQGADPKKEALRIVWMHLLNQELDRMKKERGLK